jgi:hypothetical protein
MSGRQQSRPRSTDGGDADGADPDDSGADSEGDGPVDDEAPARTTANDGPDPETGSTTEETDDESDHLNDLEDGAGCTEIWEHLSENRDG